MQISVIEVKELVDMVLEQAKQVHLEISTGLARQVQELKADLEVQRLKLEWAAESEKKAPAPKKHKIEVKANTLCIDDQIIADLGSVYWDPNSNLDASTVISRLNKVLGQ